MQKRNFGWIIAYFMHKLLNELKAACSYRIYEGDPINFWMHKSRWSHDNICYINTKCNVVIIITQENLVK